MTDDDTAMDLLKAQRQALNDGPRSHAQRIAERLAAPAGSLEYEKGSLLRRVPGFEDVVLPAEPLPDDAPACLIDAEIEYGSVQAAEDADDSYAEVRAALVPSTVRERNGVLSGIVAPTLDTPTGPRTFKVETLRVEKDALLTDFGIRSMGHTVAALAEAAALAVKEDHLDRDGLVEVSDPEVYVTVRVVTRAIHRDAGITHHLPAGLSAVTVEGK